MVRKLVLAISFALGSLPLSVYAIGLGGIKTSSALNQNFKAEIQLLSVPQGDLDTTRVKLASREAFDKVGAEYMHALSELNFEPIRRSDGTAVILVTSDNVIREPFLDFLVEVNWPNGRLVKEYTVLLDPPVTTKRRPTKISKPAVSSKQPVTAEPSRPTAPVTTQPRTYTPSAAVDEFGPVAANTTAWEIASKLKPQGISVHQMMMALLQANPHAFVNNNINQLKRGAMLRVPGIAEIQAFDHQEAVASFNRQTDAWKAGATSTAESAAPAEVGTDSGAEEPQSPEVDEDARLQIAATHPETDGEAGASEAGTESQADSDDVRHELILARENAETARLEADDLKAALGDMETQVEDLKHLLALKDEQLAQLQAAAAAAADAPQESPSAKAPAVAADTSASEPAADSSKQTSWLEDNLGMIAGGTAGLFGIGLLAMLFGGNRKKRVLLEDTGSEAGTEVTSQVQPEDETFLNEYSEEDLKALQEDTEVVDPVTEANVFIGYDRYEDAQTILQEAVDGGDNSLPTRHKLLEVYFVTRNKEDFVELAEKMVRDGQDKEDVDAWEHVRTMGKELDKINPLFQPPAPPVVQEAQEVMEELTLGVGGAAKKTDSGLDEDIESLDSEMDNLELDLSSFSLGEADKSDEMPEQAANDLDEGELEQESISTGIDLQTDLADLDELDLAQTQSEEGSEEITLTEPLEDIELGDEVDTKLELAQAYLDMGDREGAMSILKEVQEDGTDEQISSAAELMAKLNSESS